MSPPRLSLPTHWFAGSLRSRVIALFLGLLALVQIASFGAISAGLSSHARSTLPAQLEVGQRVLKSLLDRRAQTLVEGARLLAADYGFREAVLSEDAETIASALENHGGRIGATEVAWLGTDFRVVATAGADGQRGELAAAAAELGARAAAGGQASGIALVDARPHQMVLVPMKAPVLAGWVLMGFPIDDQLGRDMRELSALNLTLLIREDRGRPWQARLSTLDAEHAAQLAAQRWSPHGEALAGMRPVTLLGEAFGVHGRWLTPLASGGSDSGAAVLAIVSLSIDAATRTPRELQFMLLAITLAGFAVFAIGSVYTARHVTTPLRSLGAAAERLGAGDYATPVHGLQRGDEIGALAQSFETMRVNVADKDAQIRRLAYWDTLTGLPNRVLFRDAVGDSIAAAARGGGSLAVLMLDLDRFKHVNEVLGYHFGDLLLRGVGERLTQEVLRGQDMVARLSGDEFGVLLRDADAALAESVAQRIAHAFQRPLVLGEHKVDLGAGIGVACWPLHTTGDADTLLNRAEVAMIAAKRRASGALLYDAASDAGSAQTLSLLSELRHAVEHGELRLVLQPKLALGDGQVVGAEALVRWQHPQRGLVAPGSFIPFAEQTGFIRVLTMWVFEEAARLWLALQAHGALLKLSVNLSTRDLLDPELPSKFDALLVRHRVPAEAFCLEITESAIMDDPQRALATLNRLSAMGFRLSIDDFGTGYSSLAYLKRLPVDELKIDQSFVRNMERDLDDATIVRSTIDLAHNLGLTVVAEGVENARTWDLLRELRCDEAQGYHMGKPMPVAEFRKWSALWEQRRRPFGKSSPMRLH
ncbi:MAG: EAL domain-containing protein [Piscinibacter sp.]|nr:EAL domain-containing protein [Piscinibacter sp.]